ncbi:MAG: 3'(2'),5'-bisphosphate nucleotidase CysQ [Polymorphobacter sp.]
MSSALADAALARQLADATGALLLAIQRSGLFEGKALGAIGDQLANSLIMAALRAARPADAILSEEEAPDLARLAVSRVWIVDPLDGTREYSEGRDDWAVHIGLAIDGTAAIGAVALPALAATLCSAHPLGIVPPFDAPPRILVSRTRPAPQALAVAKALGGELVPMGSAGAKAMAVVRGDADIYLHAGGQYEWDNCAPAAVAQAAGLHVSRIDGSPLKYNCADPYLPDLLICHKDMAPAVLALVAALPPAD